ncbi:CGNR zinc finger domain-containing protein [Salinibacterium sp. G-O1]|uniref:CGNR zinc finger domain-containing protein n=1 Tax=Salinibacterium sp. G-O1 TaxID=3046208 RepID=UPI0024BAF18B|nr:CGNR zinc finger domain-containing protein [Salinibacterium sp. G-O1]MDJ0336568.1 CGNR zinc finger domain-containing protein [Salinibacterium sp. G-O1]
MQTSTVAAAPGELEFVRAFVNTWDIESNVDQLGDLSRWRVWAATHGIGGSASADELAFARHLREALRAGMLANHERAPMPHHTAVALTEAATRGQLSLRFDTTGARFVGAGSGVDGVLARVASAVASAVNNASWSRLKACINDRCQWGFYDHSRSRTGQWCSMEICGNRAKQARWRGSTQR